MEHINWKYKEKKDGALDPVLNKKEFRIFKYDEKEKQVIEIKDKKMLKAAHKLYDDGTKK